MSAQPIRILHLDDNKFEGDLLAAQLRRKMFCCTISFIQTESAYRKALSRKEFDIILCDYKMPGFDGDKAFQMAKESCPDIPFILVTGELGEEFVIERLKQGISDYVMKDNFKRLIPAIERALEQARELRSFREATEALRHSEEKYRTLFNAIDEGFCIIEVLFDENGTAYDYRFLEANAAFEKQTGLSGVVGRRMREFAPDHEEHWFRTYGRIARTGVGERFEDTAKALHRYYDVFAFRIGEPSECKVAVLFNNIADRKNSEEALRASEAKFSQAFHDSTSGMAITRMRDGVVIDVNDRWLEFNGLSRQEVIGESVLKHNIWQFPEDRSEFIREIELHGKIQGREYAFRRKNGKGWSGLVSTHVSILSGEKMLVSSVLDVTDRKSKKSETVSTERISKKSRAR